MRFQHFACVNCFAPCQLNGDQGVARARASKFVVRQADYTLTAIDSKAVALRSNAFAISAAETL